MQTFYFLRHGQTDFNKDRLWTGATDAPLNLAGEIEVALIAASAGVLNIKRIFTSPLKRARQTAVIVNEAFNATVVIDENLSERYFGIFEGTEKTDLSRAMLDTTDSVEKKSAFHARLKLFISMADLTEHTLIVSHSGVYKAFLELGIQSHHPSIQNGELVLMSMSNAIFNGITR